MKSTFTLKNKLYQVEIEIKLEEKANTTSPYLDTDLKPCTRYAEFTSGAALYERTRNHRWRELSYSRVDSQIVGCFPEHAELLERLRMLSERWHLNGMNAGTRKQSAYLRLKHPEGFSYPDPYTKACDALTRAGLNPDGEYLRPEDHPPMLPRPYGYGKRWLVETLPGDVLASLEKIVTELAAL